MPIRLEDIQAERQAQQAPAAAGISLDDVQSARTDVTHPLTQTGYGLRMDPGVLGSMDITRFLATPRKPSGQLDIPPPGALSMLGEAVGSMVPGMRPVTGALGAMGGLAAERLVKQGELPSLRETLTEGAWSIAPEILESGVRMVGRQFLRGTPGAQLLRFDEAAQQARKVPTKVFDPIQEQKIAAMFDAVRQSGVKVGTDEIAGYLSSLPPGKAGELAYEMSQIDRINKTGGRFRQAFDTLVADPKRLVGADIGQMQQLSSELRKRIQSVGDSYEARQLLQDFRETIDDAIFSGHTRGKALAGETPQVLATARREYAKLRAAEELGDLIESKISSSPDLQQASFQVRALADELRRNKSATAKSINRSLEVIPGAKGRFDQALDELAKNYKTMEVSLADVSGFRRYPLVAGISKGLSMMLLTDGGQRLLRKSVLEGRGPLSANMLATAANATRREWFETEDLPTWFQ